MSHKDNPAHGGKVIDPLYKKGKEFSVRVYTPALESQYLLVKNVARFDLKEDLSKKLEIDAGDVIESKYLDSPDFFSVEDVQSGYHEHDCILLKFKDTLSAIRSKKRWQEEVFYGRRLVIAFEPDFETLEETKAKMQWRMERVSTRID